MSKEYELACECDRLRDALALSNAARESTRETLLGVQAELRVAETANTELQRELATERLIASEEYDEITAIRAALRDCGDVDHELSLATNIDHVAKLVGILRAKVVKLAKDNTALKALHNAQSEQVGALQDQLQDSARLETEIGKLRDRYLRIGRVLLDMLDPTR